MNIWLIIAIISIFLNSMMLIYLIEYKRQIRQINEQILFILKHNTNAKIQTQVLANKEMNSLAKNINEVIEKHRKLEIELEKTNQNFKETITNISHDLRTPLTSASGYLQLMSSKETTKEKKKEYLAIIKERIDRVKELLEQLFEYARIEAKEYELVKERISINTILEQTISEFYEDFVAKGMEPNIQITNKRLSIIGDENALKRVFQNIIGNALIHGKETLAISLEVKNEKKIIQFSNQTDSIEEAEIEQLFQRFYTTDKSRTKKTTGLGLAIVKSFVEQMGGEIKASLEKGLFTITIEF